MILEHEMYLNQTQNPPRKINHPYANSGGIHERNNLK